MLLYLGLLLSIVLDYVRPGSYLPVVEALKLNSLVPLGVFAATLFYGRGPSNLDVLKHSNSKWILFFIFLVVISILTADVTYNSFNVFKSVIGFIIWYYLICRLVTDAQRMKYLFVTLVVSHFAIVLLNPALVMNPEVRSYIYGNPYMGDGNDFALSVCIVLPMCAYLALESNRLVLKLFYTACLFVLIFAVVGTQSRGAAIAMAGIFFYLWLMSNRKIWGVTILAVGIVSILSFAPAVYFERLNTIQSYQEDGSAMGRIVAWKTAIRMVEKYPITGVGAGHFPIKLGTEFRPPEYGNQNLPWLTAHSSYFLILGELGIPGIVFFLSLIGTNLRRNQHLFKKVRSGVSEESMRYTRLFLMLNGSLIGYALAGAFLSAAYYPHLYVLAGIFAAAHIMYERTKEAPDQREQACAVWGGQGGGNAVWDDN